MEISAKIKKYEARVKEIKAILDGFSKGRTGKSKRISKQNGYQNCNRKALSKRVQRLNALMKAYSEKSKELKKRYFEKCQKTNRICKMIKQFVLMIA